MKILKITEKAFGKTLPCPSCGKPLAVPQPSQMRPFQAVGTIQTAPRPAPPGGGQPREVPKQSVNPQGAPAAITRPSAAAAVGLPLGMPQFPDATPPTHARPPQSLGSCPRCGQAFQAGSALAGRMVQCPRCEAQFQMPGGACASPMQPPHEPPVTAPPTALGSLSLVAVVTVIALASSFLGSLVTGLAEGQSPFPQWKHVTSREQDETPNRRTDKPAADSAAPDSLSTTNVGATIRYTSALFKQWQDELGRARGQTQGNNIAAEKEVARVNQQNMKKIADELSRLEGQSVQWRFTVSQVLKDFINLREAPNTGYALPNDQSNPMFIWFSDGSNKQFANAPGYLKIKGNISRSHAEKLRPGDSLLIRARLTVRVVPEIGNSFLRIAIQLNNIQVLVLGDKTPNSPEVKKMLAQREKEEEAKVAEEADVRRKTFLSAAPGTRYLGTITHNTEKTVQQILLVFTEQTNSALRFQITNPDNPQRKQTFSGQVVSNLGPLDDGSRPFIIQTKAVSTSFGYDGQDQKNWWSWQPDRLFALFFCDDKATINLRVADDGMEGLGYVGFGNVFTLRLKRLQGSAPVSRAQNPLAEKIAETQPESDFLGEWTNRDVQTLGITRIHIVRARGSNRIVVRLWTKSKGPTREWKQGEANATLGTKVLSVNQTSLVDVDKLEMTLLENGDMQVDAHPRFSGRESVDHISGKSVFRRGLVRD
jgi:hypothetical protein